LFLTSSSAGIPFQESAFFDANNADQWKAIPFPSTDDEPALTAFGPSFSILQSTPERQLAAWLYLKWLLSPENQARWTEYYGTFPGRFSVQTHLAEYQKEHPQWAEVLDLLPYSRSEPRDPSWEAVRWSLSDAGEQLFSLRFTSSRIPDLLEMLDATVIELSEQYH
jgi:ABC-type glycerol-3-phosphate transport system substrate-binding protein